MMPVEKIRTINSEIWIDDEGILHLSPNEGAEVDLQEVKACFAGYRRLGCTKDHKRLQLIHATSHFTMTTQARDYTAKHVSDYFIASAAVSRLLAARIIINFFNSFYKNNVPLRMFGTEEEALKWLRSFRKI